MASDSTTGRVATTSTHSNTVMQPVIPLNPRNGWLGWWPAEGLRSIFDPENGRIRAFLQEEVEQLAPGAHVLDASAGTRPYSKYFHRQNYESCDMPGGFYTCKHDFECLLDSIPRPTGTYDAVILTQVLEHVPNPTAVLAELNRVLKPGGVLLLSVPLNGPLHGEPWHFFQFTHYGLSELAKSNHFAVERLEKVGGAFWFFGKHVQDTCRKLMKQVDPFRARKRGQSVAKCILWSLLFLPVWIVGVILLGYVFRPVSYWLDRFDFAKTLTIGYTAVLKKYSP